MLNKKELNIIPFFVIFKQVLQFLYPILITKTLSIIKNNPIINKILEKI